MVSVIIPNYNHEAYLKQRIDSVLNQTYQDFEIIILDDKSSDNSRNIIEQYRNHPKITHIVYNEVNSSSTFAQWDKGINLSTGDYIWIAESDDYSDNLFLETLINKINNEDDVSIAFCQSYKVNEKSEITGNWSEQTQYLPNNIFKNDFVLDGIQFLYDFLIYENFIPNASGVLFSRKKYIEVKGTSSKIGFCGDWLLWMKLLTVGKIAFSCKKLNYFRSHSNSVVAKAFNNKYKVYKARKYNYKLRIYWKKYLKHIRIKDYKPLLISNERLLRKAYFHEIKLLKSERMYIKAILYYYKYCICKLNMKLWFQL